MSRGRPEVDTSGMLDALPALLMQCDALYPDYRRVIQSLD